MNNNATGSMKNEFCLGFQIPEGLQIHLEHPQTLTFHLKKKIFEKTREGGKKKKEEIPSAMVSRKKKPKIFQLPLWKLPNVSKSKESVKYLFR